MWKCGCGPQRFDVTERRYGTEAACAVSKGWQNQSKFNNYLLDKKKENFFSMHFFSTRTKKQWKKVVLFLSDIKFCFFKQLASALEETMSVARPHFGKPKSLLIGASRKQSEEVSKYFFFLSDIKFCFMKRLFLRLR
jgi:hypothetical protein